jgi:hypothetical protein
MQKQKNIILLFALSFTAITIALLPFFLGTNQGQNLDKKQFTLNQETVITDVILKSDSNTNKLSYINGVWKVNSDFDLDLNMRDVFFSVLSQMEIRRAVSSSQNDSILSLIKNQGVEVTILNNQNIIKKYLIWGDKERQVSYISTGLEESFLIHIPGYKSYVAGIFEVPESDWRSRRVFSALFTNLNTLKIIYPNEEIEFRYKDRFFEIVGMNADSTQLIESLENLLFLQTDKYLLPTEYVNYSPQNFGNDNTIVNVQVSKLSGASEKLSIFNTKLESPYYLGITADSTYCLFDKKRINRLLVKKSDFQ